MAGSLYLQFHFNKQAESEFKQAIELEPSDHCYFQIGRSYLEHGKVKKALKHFGLASTTASFAVLMDISDALLRAEYPHEAEQYLDLAIYKEPWNPEGHLNKSFAWAARMKLEEAWREVNEAERLARERTEFAGFLDEARSTKRAIQEMRQIQELIMGKKNSLSPLSPKLSDAMPPLAKFGRPS
jgi:tetratricopeptide (TPR) repeat protein